jgi:hypothetical protein
MKIWLKELTLAVDIRGLKIPCFFTNKCKSEAWRVFNSVILPHGSYIYIDNPD